MLPFVKRRFLPFRLALICIVGLFWVSCGGREVVRPSPAYQQAGLASYYARSLNGRQTASGEIYDENALTAAHPRLLFGTRLRVTHVQNGRTVDVRVNDRGPFVKGRIIDLSYAAARKLGMLKSGVVRVKIESLP
jgi:rare lipoprotein A